MAKNGNLSKAKKAKNDEFYTQIGDIENELKHYKKHFRGKTVFCNCDDPEYSSFWKYFHLNFEHLGLKKLITTHYHDSEPTYKMEYEGGNDADTSIGKITPLKQNGDFRSPECIELLNSADIVVTNPPFSLFREYIGQLMQYDKRFVIVGNQNAITYKEIFPLIKDGLVWWGVSDCIRWFMIPDDVDMKYKVNEKGQRIAEGARSRWWTNLDHKKRHESIDLVEHYSPDKYPKYDNYDAINVDKTLDIPCDYDGVVGVPISFMDKYCPEQFEIIGMAEDNGKGYSGSASKWDGKNPHCLIDGKAKFKRIFIRRRKG